MTTEKQELNLQNMAGKFRNLGLNEAGIYDALKEFVATRRNCTIDDDKLKELTHAVVVDDSLYKIISVEELDRMFPKSVFRTILAANAEAAEWNRDAIASRTGAR